MDPFKLRPHRPRTPCHPRCQKIGKSLLRGAGEHQALDFDKTKQREKSSIIEPALADISSCLNDIF
jgi:hypothetical protein